MKTSPSRQTGLLFSTGLIALLPALLASSCAPPGPGNPAAISPPAAGVVLAYAGGGLGERLVVRSSPDGLRWIDWGLDAPLRQIEGPPAGVAMAGDVNSVGHRVVLGLGSDRARSYYGLATRLWQSSFAVTWDRQVRDDVLVATGATTAASVAPFGVAADGWLMAFGTVQSDGTTLPRLLLQPTAVPDAAASAPLAEVATPLPATTPINGRPYVFARGRSKVLFAYRPLPASNGQLVVQRGDAAPAQRQVLWNAPVGWSGIVNSGLQRHEIRDVCLSGDGGNRFVLGVLLDGVQESGSAAGTVTQVVRLFRSDNGGASFSRVQFLARASTGSGQTFAVDYFPGSASALGCAMLPGGDDVLVATVGSAANGSVEMQALRVQAAGTFDVLPQGADDATTMFPRPPKPLPFALLAIGSGTGR